MNNKACLTNRVRKVLFLLFFAVIILTFSQGCQEKKVAPKAAGPSGTCDILEQLPKDIAKSVDVNYGNKIRLLGVTVSKLSKNQLKVFYYWQFLDELGSYKQIFVHFTNTTNDKILFQDDHLFCQNHMADEMKGKFVKEADIVNIPQSEVDKEVNILVGVYAPKLESYPRLKVESTKGAPVIGNAAIVEKFSLQR